MNLKNKIVLVTGSSNSLTKNMAKKSEGDQQLIERFIGIDEIGDGAVFIAKNDSMTGSIIVMDGGISLKSI